MLVVVYTQKPTLRQLLDANVTFSCLQNAQ